ncbi:hypothetical protein ACS0TY_031981 [Phlomoides rotata]
MKSKFIVLSIFPENERRKGDHPTEIRWRGNGEQNVELIYKKGNNSSSNLCLSSSLDPTAVRGKVVVCDRGIQREGAGSRWRRDDSGEHGGEVGRELVAVGQKTVGDRSSNLAMANLTFKEKMTFESRQAAAAWALENHPDRLPVVLENAWGSQLPVLDQKTFLVPAVYTVGQFAHSVRDANLHHLAAEKPIYMFVNNIPLQTAASMSALYEEHKDADGILYMTYSH